MVYQIVKMKKNLQPTPFPRSKINALIADSIKILARQVFFLPPYAYWTPQGWLDAGPEWDSLRQAHLGWDVTDFGWGQFSRVGRVLFTLRNGISGENDKPYAEKIIVGRHRQRAPAHWHIRKVEDIINRGGGEVVVELGPREGFEAASIRQDGREMVIHSSTTFRLQPGESLCIPPGTVHQFWGEETQANSVPLIGEISSFCDDIGDNVFLQDVARFAQIIEDEPAQFSLCHELPGSRKIDAPELLPA